MNFLAPGVVAGALALASAVANSAGYPVAGAFLGDPGTAGTVSNLVTGALALYAGWARGARHAAR